MAMHTETVATHREYRIRMNEEPVFMATTAHVSEKARIDVADSVVNTAVGGTTGFSMYRYTQDIVIAPTRSPNCNAMVSLSPDGLQGCCGIAPFMT